MANKFTVTVALPTLTSEEIGSDPSKPEVVQRRLTAAVEGTEVFNQTFDATLASIVVGSVDAPLLEGQTVHYELFNIDDGGNVSVARAADNLVHDTTPPPAPGELGFTANELP